MISENGVNTLVFPPVIRLNQKRVRPTSGIGSTQAFNLKAVTLKKSTHTKYLGTLEDAFKHTCMFMPPHITCLHRLGVLEFKAIQPPNVTTNY